MARVLLYMDSPAAPEDVDGPIETLDAAMEDSLSLEPLEALVGMHAEAGKHLVIARVSTRDRKDVRRTYHSHYWAHQLNKIIFARGRARPGAAPAAVGDGVGGVGADEVLVSRYQVGAGPNMVNAANVINGLPPPLNPLNPLNNSEIVGEVSYFRVLGGVDDYLAHPALMHLHGVDVPPVPARVSSEVRANEASANAPANDAPDKSMTNVSHLVRTSDDSSDGSDDQPGRRNARTSARMSPLPGSMVPMDELTSSGGLAASGGSASLSADVSTRAFGRGPARSTAPLVTPEGDYIAIFVGTDYNYVHSEEVRQVLAENALTEGDGELPIDARFGRTEAGEGGGVEGNLLEEELVFALAQIRAMGEAERRDGRDGAVRVPFVNSVIYGMFVSNYVLVSFFLFAYAIRNLMATTTASPTAAGPWYWACFPLFSFFTDRMTSFVCRAQEAPLAVATKIVFWTVYVGLPVVFFRGDEGSFNYARAVLDIAFVLLTLTYSFGYYLFLSSKKRLI